MKLSRKKMLIGAIIIAVGLATVILAVKITKLESDSEQLDASSTKTLSGEDIEMEYAHLVDKNFYFKVPTSFKSLTSAEILEKYQNGNLPDAVFSNAENTINVAVSLSKTGLVDDDVIDYRDSVKETFELASAIENAETYDFTANGHTVAALKFTTTLESDNTFNEMAIFSYEDTATVVSFNCYTDLKDEWKNVSELIIKSLYFKEQ